MASKRNFVWPLIRVRLNRLRTGLFRSKMHKWDLVPSANCRGVAEEQTADNILASCPMLYHPPNGTLGLAALNNDNVDWLQTTALYIWWNNRPKRRRGTQLSQQISIEIFVYNTRMQTHSIYECIQAYINQNIQFQTL